MTPLRDICGHSAARVLAVPLCFLLLTLPLASGLAGDPGPKLMVAVFSSWLIVICLLAALAYGANGRNADHASDGSARGAEGEGQERGA